MKSNQSPLLRVLCVIGFLGCFIRMIYILLPSVQNVNSWYPIYLSLSTLYVIICLAGFWWMRKWAFWAFAFYTLIHQWVHFHLGIWEPEALILALALLVTALANYKKMT